MNVLQKALETFLPRECILRGSSVSEKGRSFVIRKNRGDKVVGARIKGIEGKKTCDAVFLCRKAGMKSLGVVLVELKGGNVSRAVKQISDTASWLCRKGGEPHNLVEKSGLGGHGGRVNAFIVARKGLQQKQIEKARLSKRGIRLVIKSRSWLTVDISEVAAA